LGLATWRIPGGRRARRWPGDFSGSGSGEFQRQVENTGTAACFGSLTGGNWEWLVYYAPPFFLFVLFKRIAYKF
jgi:hypothetical protein